jgi:SHS2 domain-containing protein
VPAAQPRYDYFDHDADTGVIGRGATLEEAFVHAAEATFALMCDPLTVELVVHIEFEFDEDDVELALVTWLNGLLAHAAERRLALGRFELLREASHWCASAWGEPWRADMERGTQVKGATLTALSVAPASGGWEARCVVDL